MLKYFFYAIIAFFITIFFGDGEYMTTMAASLSAFCLLELCDRD